MLFHVSGEVGARKFGTGKVDSGGGQDVHDVDGEGDRLGANRRDSFDGQATVQELRPIVAFPEVAK